MTRERPRKRPHPFPGNPFRIRQSQHLGGTIGDAPGLPPAKIAFGGNAFHQVQRDRARRANADAHGAADADIGTNEDHPVWFLAVEGAGRADVHAGRIPAIETDDRDIHPLPQRNDLDVRAPRVADPVVMKRADQLAQPAAAALRLRILPVFKISHTLFGHPIPLIRNAKAADPSPGVRAFFSNLNSPRSSFRSF